MEPIELVVARYREPVRWTRNVPPGLRVTIYDKGADLDAAGMSHASVVLLPNYGFEAHSYLAHILAHWESLSELTVFCQGHPFDHAHDLHHVLRALADGSEVVADFRWLGFIIDTDDVRGRRLFVPWSKNRDGRELDLDGFHRRLFGEPAPEWLRFHPGGQFAVRRERIRSRPREFWERALELSLEFPDAGHCFERLWDRVFGVLGVDSALLGGERTRYLKPLRKMPA